MFFSILARLFGTLARRWQRVLLVQLFVLAMVTIAVGFFALVAYGYSDTPALRALAFVGLAITNLLGTYWLQVSGVRAASGTSGIFDASFDTIGAALRLIPFGIVLGAISLLAVLIHPLLALMVAVILIVPVFVAVGDAAMNHGHWGFGAAIQLGLKRIGRNIGAYLGTIIGGLLILVLAAALLLGPAALFAGAPPAQDAALDTWTDWAGDGLAGLILGGIFAAILLNVAGPILAWAVYSAVSASFEPLADEELEAVRVEHELSPAVAALLGDAVSGRRRRMQIPPRAQQPGRLPGPGVLSVADVTLPPGATGRPVDSPTLELDVFDSAPGGGTGSVAAAVAPAMWISSAAVPNVGSAWKRLAAGFAESGLWPLLLPDADFGTAEFWTEQRARRERDSLDATAEELFRSRLEGSLRSTPLASTESFAMSGITRGELARGSGRRTDALEHAFAAIGPARLALVAVDKPAQAVHRTAWPGTIAADITGAELAQILVSWEERWAALLVGMSPATLTFAVLRPPATLGEAVEAAAEHHALCPDEADEWGDDRAYAETLLSEPVWRLSWT